MGDFSSLSGNIHLGVWDFKVIDLVDKDIYSQYIKQTEYPANLWTSNFDLLWAVSQSRGRKVLWKIVDDMLVTFGYLRSGFLYLICLPFGSGDAVKVTNVTQKCLNYCHNWNKDKDPGAIVKVVNEQQLNFLRQSKDFSKYFKVIGLVGMEKHFSIKKLVSLSGKEFDTIRRKVNKFKKSCPNAVVREYTANDFDAVMKLGDAWNESFGKKYAYIFDGVYFKNIMLRYKELGHLVLVVEIDKKIIGMVSGGELPTGQSWWCLSKFGGEYDGISEFLIVELAREIYRRNPKVELMNAAEDLGPGGLRFFKERFRPVLNLRRYLIELR